MHASVTITLACVPTAQVEPTPPAAAPTQTGAEPLVFVEPPPEPAQPVRVAQPVREPEPARASDGTSEDDRVRAKAAFQQGAEQFEAGQFELALEQFESGYLLVPLPALMFNIGRCHEALGHPIHACQAYVEVQANTFTDDHIRAAAADRIVQLGC